MSNFLGSQVTELRIYVNPDDPEHSDVLVILPNTVIEAVFDSETGDSLVQVLAAIRSAVNGHIANTDVHTTAEWKNNVAQAIGTITIHVADDGIHVTAEEKAGWNGAATTAAAALELSESNSGSISTIQGQIEQILESLYSDITANPWAVSFDNLDGITVTHGIYNQTLQRIEC